MLIVNFIGGIDISIILATIVPYLKKTIKVTNVNLFYSLTTAAFCIGSAFFGMFAGKIVDRTRLIKLFTIATLLLQIIGNLIYTIPVSPYFALFGRLLAGAGESFTSVCIGEVIRIYDMEGSNKVICWLATMSSFGYVIGPLLAVPLSNCHFKIFSLTIDGYNVAGLLIAIICTLTLILCLGMVSNCSKVFNMKAYLVEHDLDKEPDNIDDEELINGGYGQRIDYQSNEQEENGLLNEKKKFMPGNDQKDSDASNKEAFIPTGGKGDDNEASNRKVELITIEGEEDDSGASNKTDIFSTFHFIRSFDQWMILIFSFLMMFIITSGESMFPLINYEIMKWNLNALVMIFMSYGIILLVVSLILSRVCVDDYSIYCVGLLSLPGVIIFYTALLWISLSERNKTFDIIYMCLLVLSLVFIWFLESVALRSMLGRTVTSDVQSFAEALRNALSRIGMILSCFLTPFLMTVLNWYSFVFAFVGLVMLVVYAARRKSLVSQDGVPCKDIK